MTTVYIDSSVLLRKIFGESGAIQRLSDGKKVISSELLEVECLRTVDRLRIQYGLSDEQVAMRSHELYSSFKKIGFLQLSSTILERAKTPFPTIIGSLDAIHLSSAVLWAEETKEDILFLTHDLALGRAALALGFDVKGI